MKVQWQTILRDASNNSDPDPLYSPASPIGHVAPGDEREEGSVVTKMRDRKYRVGMTHLNLIVTNRKRCRAN